MIQSVLQGNQTWIHATALYLNHISMFYVWPVQTMWMSCSKSSNSRMDIVNPYRSEIGCRATYKMWGVSFFFFLDLKEEGSKASLTPPPPFSLSLLSPKLWWVFSLLCHEPNEESACNGVLFWDVSFLIGIFMFENWRLCRASWIPNMALSNGVWRIK